MDNTRTDISAYHLVTNPDVYEPQKTNAFKFFVTDLDPLEDPTTGKIIPNAGDILKESVYAFDPPAFSQAPIEVRMGNTVMKTAGTPTFNNGTLRLHDWVGAETYDVLYAWQAKSFNIKTGRVGLAKDYKKTAYLIEYTSDFATIVRVWKLYGVWVQELSRDGSWNNADNANEMRINCNLVYDWAEPVNPEEL